METSTIRKYNTIIGKALLNSAKEAYGKRILKMLERPFDEVVEAMKTYKETKQNKANGYFADEAIRFFDKMLEDEHEDIWMEIEDICDYEWFEAIEIFRW